MMVMVVSGTYIHISPTWDGSAMPKCRGSRNHPSLGRKRRRVKGSGLTRPSFRNPGASCVVQRPLPRLPGGSKQQNSVYFVALRWWTFGICRCKKSGSRTSSQNPGPRQ